MDYSDPVYRKCCKTVEQIRTLDIVNSGISREEAAKQLNIKERALRYRLNQIKYQADQSFIAGDVTIEPSPGFEFGKVTTQIKPEYECPKCGHIEKQKIERIWPRQHKEPVDYLVEALENLEYKPANVIPLKKYKRMPMSLVQ